jgi:diadenosine tetraphosphate (Ap4A) HIT family hydrolase
MRPRQAYDLESYVQRSLNGPCFICEFLKGNPDYHHRAIYEDEFAVAFLAKAPTQDERNLTTAYGYTLVVPRQHREHIMEDFTVEEYLRLQRLVYSVGVALKQELPTERIYVLSLGSQQGNSHAHWHVVALPPGIEYAKQQFHFLMSENGVIEVTDVELDKLAESLRKRLNPLTTPDI